MAVLSSTIKGASEIYCVDRDAGRLSWPSVRARSASTSTGRSCRTDQGYAAAKSGWLASLRPGEEKMDGVMHGIDAVGYQARYDQDPSRENPMQVFDDLIRVVNPTGMIGMVGSICPKIPGGVDEKAKQGVFEIPWGQVFNKGLTIGMGQAPVKRYNEYLRDLIIAGKAKPSFIVSHRLPLNAAPDAYKHFDERGDDYTKVILKPEMASARARS